VKLHGYAIRSFFCERFVNRLILKSFQSPGDIVVLSAAVRDLHRAYPGRFQTDVRTSADAIWENNPHVTPLREGDPEVRSLDMHYPLIHESNQRPYHFLHGYAQFLEQQLDLRIPVTAFRGDIHLSEAEKQMPPLGTKVELPDPYWILLAGGKYDFTAKWWNPSNFQAVVDHFRGRITFVQCGESGHWHPELSGVVNVVGKTTLREFIRLMYHAEGAVCGVTLAMHLAAAIETKPGSPRIRPCVVVAGGREPAHWEAYPNHQFISTNGALSCCTQGGCWKSRCQPVGDGDSKDTRDVCEQPVQIRADLRIPKCMDMITPEEVIRRIELYYQGGCLKYSNGHSTSMATTPAAALAPTDRALSPPLIEPIIKPKEKVLVEFRHGLGDAVQLTAVLKHLRKQRPDWDIDVASLVGKHSAFSGLCRNTFAIDRDSLNQSEYGQVFRLDWEECRTPKSDCPSTKVTQCLSTVFQLSPVNDLCKYEVAQSELATSRARQYLESICDAGADQNGRFPAVLIHYEGNTSSDKKNLSHELVREVCEVVLTSGAVPVILDWDRRSPLPDGVRIHNPGPDHPLWGDIGTGDAEMLAALIEASRLMIGVDSGPLHVAGATSTPTIGVWTHHHPVHYFDLADNVLHLVPGNHEQLAHGAPALAFFTQNYKFRTYKQLDVDLCAHVESLLTGQDFEQIANRRFLRRLSSRAFNHHYYHEHKRAGLDYLGFGDWQQQYGRWLVESLELRDRRVLDVGCACGAILRGLGQAGAIVQGVDVNEHMIRLAREKWPDMAPLLFVCDAVNLHLFDNASWDAIHTAQVAEHWKPELVPFILRELARIVVPNGLLFCALDTEELFARQNRRIEEEDPTHVCIRPMAWWHDQLAQAGWHVRREEYRGKLMEHPLSFLSRYDWDWFVAERGQS
jgi:ADP-heptose:LPS heptosyltransferase/2-polyprenyl-3-methyl-5-hydroxy-6-metoxy-1,4-benzoquinol methylase